jgi:hypothetical protein
LALAVTGCGGTTARWSGGKATPTPSASATTTPAPSLTLAEASSPSYKAQFPLVPCTSLSPALRAAWAPLLIGSSVGKCAPADYLAKYVPQDVTVTNYDKSISQAQANAYGQALVNTSAWVMFTTYDDAPSLLNSIGQGQGPNLPMLQWEQNGAHITSPAPGQSVFPTKIVLIPLTSAGQSLMLNHNATFALAVEYNQTPYGMSWTAPGQSFSKFSDPPQLFTGTVTTNAALGTYFQVATYSNDCSIGPDVSLCQAAGIS